MSIQALSPRDTFLSPEQETAVNTIDRPVLVLAPPGTGKTELLTRKYARLVEEYGMEAVIALTFTKKAAAEIAHRTRGLLEQRIDTDSKPMIGTFHSLGNYVLRRAKRLGLYSGPTQLIEERDQEYMLAAALRGYSRHEVGTTEAARASKMAALKDLRQQIDRTKNAGFVAIADGYWNGVQIFPIVRNLPAKGSQSHIDMVRYQAAMTTAGVLDYNDVILNSTQALLENRHAILPGLKALLVDEYQDTNAAQETMIAILAEGAHLTCVGDDKQSIYGWRGAQVDNILSFLSRRGNALSIELTRNFRSNKSIEKLSRRLLDIDPPPSTLKAFLEETGGAGAIPAIQFHHITVSRFNAAENARQMTPIIENAIINNPNLRYDDVAVLVRSNNDATALKEALGSAGHNAHVLNPNSLSSPPLRRLMAWLRLLNNPNDYTSVAALTEISPSEHRFAAMMTSARERGQPMMAYLQDLATQNRLGHAAFRNLVKTYRDYLKILQSQSLVDLLNTIAKDEDKHLSFDVSGEKQTRFWSAFGISMLKAIETNSLRQVVDLLGDSLVDSDLIANHAEGGSIEIATIHAMKGRQRRAVFIGPIFDGILPMGLGTKIDPKRMDEERRLFYVAMTRASHELHLIFGPATQSTFFRNLSLSA